MNKACFALFAGAALLAGAQTAAAQMDIMSQLDAIVQKSTAELAVQINLSGKQRMLTQKMSKESFLVALGVEPEKNRANLKRTMALFERTLYGLRDGEPSLRLAKTTNKGIRKQLEVVMGLWKGFKPLVAAVAAGKMDKAILKQIYKKNLPLLAEMNKAVKMYEVISGADTADLAVVINLSGKQRMLTQRMSKEFLLIALGIDKQTNRNRLNKTTALFDRTLKGLRDGDEGLRLPPTTDPKIRAQLDVVRGLWEKFHPLLKKPATAATLGAVARANLPLLAEMNRAVKMYEESW